MSDFPEPTRIATNGVTLSVHIAGPAKGQPVLLCHGWPELARSWKNQAGPLADAGYRVIMPDQRGFGASDAPEPVEAYGIDNLVGDLTGLLDALGHERAVFAGHDWGGIVVWHAAMLAPERFDGVIGVNTPHMPRPPIDPVSLLSQISGPDNYIVRFQERGVPEAVFTGREDDFFAFSFGKIPTRVPDDLRQVPPSAFDLLGRFSSVENVDDSRCVVPAKERAIYAETYRKSGFSGGINWYRNLPANWKRMEGESYVIEKPALMISASNDIYLPPAYVEHMVDLVPDLERHVIDDCGHWTQWEKPDELNALMLDWLGRRFPPS